MQAAATQTHSATPRRVLVLSALWGFLGLSALGACSGMATHEMGGSSSLAPSGATAATGASASQASGMMARADGNGLVGGAPGGERSPAGGLEISGEASGASGSAADAGSGAGHTAAQGDAGDAGARAGCSPAACSGGACWQRPDGVEECVKPLAQVPTVACESFDAMCCSDDSECSDGTGGRCISSRATYFGCGGAVPIGNRCNYAACASDADCLAATPAGATLAACLPAGALGLFTSACSYGGCRTDADCTLQPGGECRFGEAATHGTCDRRRVFFCAYPNDPCETNSDCQQAGSFMVCVPEENYQGRHCAPPPPMYP